MENGMRNHEFIKNCLKKSNPQEQKKHKHIFTAIILSTFNEHYDYFTSEEFKGAFILDSTVEEMVQHLVMQINPPVNSINGYAGHQSPETQIDSAAIILFLMIGIYSEISYLLQKNEFQFNNSFEAEATVLLEYLLCHSSNYRTYRKVKTVRRLVDKDRTKLGKTEVAKYCHGMMNIFIQISEKQEFQATINELMQCADEEQITSAKVWRLVLKNREIANNQGSANTGENSQEIEMSPFAVKKSNTIIH